MFDSAHTWFRRGSEALAETRFRSPAELVRAACRAAEELAAQSPEAELRQCGAGCTACCHFTVGVTAVEASQLARAVSEHPEADQLRARIGERAAEAQASAQAPRERRPCALLQSDGRCAVYSSRPLACRGWNSTDRVGCEMEHRGLGGTPRPDGATYHAVLGLAHQLEERGAPFLATDARSEADPRLRGHFELHHALHRLLTGDGELSALLGARRPFAANRSIEASSV